MARSLNADVAVYLPMGERFSPHRGGALATWTHEVYGRLAEKANAVVIANSDPAPYASLPLEPCAANPLCRRMAISLRNRRLLGTVDFLKSFLRRSHARHAAKICHRLHARIIHVHNDPEAVVPIRRSNPAATIVLHMNNDHLIEGQTLASAPGAVRAADWVACCSQYVMEGALAKLRDLRLGRCFVIHNGADLPPTPVWPARGFKSADGPVVLFVGRVVEQKGVHLLLAAMQHVLARFPNAALRIVGGVRFGSSDVDPYLAGLRARAAQFRDRVQFVGPVAHTEIGGHFREADVFVCPSIWNDPFPLVNLEAMGAGVPVVAFARGGIPEGVGECGLLVTETNSGALADAIVGILTDPDRRRELAQNGRERIARNFTWDIIAKQWQTRLEEWLEGRGNSLSEADHV